MSGQLKGALCVSVSGSTAATQWESHRQSATGPTLAHEHPKKLRGIMVKLVAVSSRRKYPKKLKEFRTNDGGLHATGKYLGLSFNDVGSCSALQNEI